jgi:hypothetical protein
MCDPFEDLPRRIVEFHLQGRLRVRHVGLESHRAAERDPRIKQETDQ